MAEKRRPGSEKLEALKRRIVELEGLIRRGFASPPDSYRALFENSADAILILDGEHFVDCNQATVEMLGYRDKQELLQTHPSELSPEYQPDGRRSFDKANEMMAIAFREGSHRFEWEHKRADGEVFPVEVLLTAVPEKDRSMLHVVWRDITERRRLEGELRQAQKMEAVGKLAGGIAHDFNNLLAVILGHVDLLISSAGDKPALELEEVRHAAERAASLVGQLLAFSRKQMLQPKVIDLGAAIERVSSMLRRVIGEHIQLVYVPPESPLQVKADPGQIDQVLMNLVHNARDAMAKGGTLTLRLRELPAEAAGEASDGSSTWACLEVEDTGSGMDAQTLSRAFDPFFTTKQTGRGTGLGLSTVHGIVHQSGGSIRLRSVPGRGTTVTVLLPLSDQPLTLLQPRRRSSSDVKGGRILVVEDELEVAALVQRVLTRGGYEVIEVHDGEQALKLVQQGEASGLDLIVSDVVMPNLGGPEFVARLGAEFETCPVIFMSGYTDNALEEQGFDPAKITLLRKPFTATVLLDLVAATLEKSRLPTATTPPARDPPDG